MPTFLVTHQGQKFRITADSDAAALEAFNGLTSGGPQVTAEPKYQGSVAAGVRGAADTLTFGLSDEIAAGLSAATGLHGQFGDYEGNLRRQRQVQAFDEQNNPTARTVGQVAGGVGSGVGLARAGVLATPRMAGAAALPRYGVAAGEGAALSAAYGLGSGEGAEGRLEEGAKALGPGAVFGVVGERAAPLISRGAGWVSDTARSLWGAANDPAVLARAKADMGKVLGIDPAQIGDDMAAEFAKRAADAVDPAHAARSTVAGEFGIPLTRGQATGDMTDLAFEEASRNQGRGVIAGNTVRRFDEQAREAIDRSKLGIAEEIDQGRSVTTTSQNNLAQETLDAIRAAERQEWQGVDHAYDAARASGVTLKTGAVQSAGTAIRQGLDEKGFVINPTSNPYASRALDEVDKMVNLKGALASRTATGAVEPGAEVAGVSVAGIDKVRSKILQYRQNANPEDARAVNAVRQQFDEWLDSISDDQLLAGTPEGIELFKAARKARREYGRKFESDARQGDDDAGRLIEKMINKNVTETEVANWLAGSAKAGERGDSARLAARLKEIFGQDSPEFGAVKQAAWFKVVNGDAGEAAKLGPQAISQRILRFTTGKAEPYANILYTPAELAKMRRFAAAVGQTVTPPAATNPSKSGYEMVRAVQDAAKSVLPMMATAAGGVGAGLFTRVAAGAVTEGKNLFKARRAARGAPRLPYGPTSRGATSGGASGYSDSGSDPMAINLNMPRFR